MVRCPECAAAIDVDEDEVEEGEILACSECEFQAKSIGQLEGHKQEAGH